MFTPTLPNARGSGLAQSVGRVPFAAAGLAVAIGLGSALSLGVPGVGAAVAATVVCTALALIARAKIGGQTGDILGASQQLAEAAALCILASALA